MPIGLFENELTVQLWQPVTIRGLHLQRGRQPHARPDRRSQKTAAGRGQLRLALSRPTRPSGPAPSSRTFWNRLPPPLAPRGEEGADALADRVPERPVRDPAGGQPADAAVPLRQDRRARRRRDDRAGQLLRGARRRRVPLPGDPRARRRLPGRALEAKHPDYLGGGLADDDQGAPASSATRSASSSRPAGPRWSTAPTCARSRRGSGPATSRSGSPTRGGSSRTRRCRRTSPPARPARRRCPKTFENKPLEMVRAIRDTLLNYVNAVEQQLAGASKRTPRPAVAGAGRIERQAVGGRRTARSSMAGTPSIGPLLRAGCVQRAPTDDRLNLTRRDRNDLDLGFATPTLAGPRPGRDAPAVPSPAAAARDPRTGRRRRRHRAERDVPTAATPGPGRPPRPGPRPRPPPPPTAADAAPPAAGEGRGLGHAQGSGHLRRQSAPHRRSSPPRARPRRTRGLRQGRADRVGAAGRRRGVARGSRTSWSTSPSRRPSTRRPSRPPSRPRSSSTRRTASSSRTSWP